MHRRMSLLRGRWSIAVGVGLLAAISLAAAPLPPSLASGGGRASVPAEKNERLDYGSDEARGRALDTLFAELKRADNGFVALALTEQIWLYWHRSGRRDVDDLLSLAKINASEGEFAAALDKFDRLQRLAPKFAEGWNGRATVLYQMGRYQDSLAAIEKTLNLEPRHFGALAGRGMIHFREERYRDALKAFEEALRHNPFIAERETILPVIRRRLGIREL